MLIGRHLPLLLCLAMLAVFPSCARAAETVTLQLKWLHHFQFAGYYMALEKGFYRQAGLDVVIRPGSPETEVEQELQRGRAQFGIGTSALLLDRAKGQDFVVLAQIFQHSPAILLTPRTSGIATIKDMAGRRIMYSNQHGDILALFKQNGLTEQQLVKVAHQGNPLDLLHGKADLMLAYSFNEPFVLEHAGQPYRTFSPRASGIDFYGDNLFCLRSYAEQHPELVRAFRAASLQGWRYALQHKQETADLILSKYSQVKSRQWLLFEAAGIEELIQPDLVELGYQNPARWQQIANTLIDLGMLPKGFEAAPIIYAPPTRSNYLPIIAISLVSLLVIAMLAGLSITLRKLNRRLQQEAHERRQVEQQLEADRNYLRVLFEHNGSGHLVVSSTRTILKVNRQFCEMFGYREEELLGQSVRILHLDEQHYLDWAPRFLEVRDNMTRMSAEYPSLRKDGSVIWCMFTGVRLSLPSGGLGVVWSLIDISDRKKAEEELRLSEQKYANIFKLMPDMIGITRCSDGCFIEVNPGFERCTGWSRDEVLGQSSLTLGLWDKNTRNKAIEMVKKQGHLEELEFILTTKTGLKRHALMYLIPITIEGVECLCFLARDIHDKRIAERALQRFSLVVEQTANIVVITDPAGIIQYVNPRFSEVTGYSRQEAIGRNPRLLKSGHQSQEIYNELWQTITSGRPWRGEFCNRAKDGSEFWELATITPLFDEGGTIINFVAIKEVITDRKQAEVALHEAKDRAESANRAKSEFLANMSHEIRTPMNGVIGMVQLLRTTDLSLEQRQYLTNIEISATSLTTLLSDILDLSRIEAGKMLLERTDFSLRQCIRDLLDSQLFQVREKGLLVNTNLAPELPEIVRGDQLRTRQILLNLVGNAIKFTEQGRIEITANVILRDKAKLLVRLDVADSGIGMPAEQLERIFAPFEQADNSTTRRYGGSGLGLAICRRLAALMGGSIWAESTPDVGSTFHLELPFGVPDLPANTNRQPECTDNQLAGSPLTLLLAEDNRVNAEFISKILTKMGHRVTTCENGRQALDCLLSGQLFDAILMDIQMPVMGGDEAVRLIRQQEEEQGQGCHIPIIALTAHAMDDERQRLLTQGFDAHVAKPVEIGILLAELVRLTHAPGHGPILNSQDRS